MYLYNVSVLCNKLRQEPKNKRLKIYLPLICNFDMFPAVFNCLYIYYEFTIAQTLKNIRYFSFPTLFYNF